MNKIYYITGGARSGKSGFAENIAKGISEKVLYIATSEAFDKEMEERIKKHVRQRPESWKTVEIFSNFRSLEENIDFEEADTLLFDCLSLMVNNHIYYANFDFENIDFNKLDDMEDKIEAEFLQLVELCKEKQKSLIIVTNEIGMGIVPNNPLSRSYRDMLGRLNRKAQEVSDESYFLVSGVPLKLKG
ncbi:MAG: bifunctional adenosylcobinamide kinase/adenosylcobinamide-phosphate guanylyltransferase [Eubacteriales bacterium]